MTRSVIVVTGAAGFIGSHLVDRLLATTRHDVVAVDALTYAGHRANLRDAEDRYGSRLEFVHADICDFETMARVLDGASAVFNLAAETHVDRSIRADDAFVRINVLGTQTLLAAARAGGVQRFIQVSTDEVYGELPWVDPEAPEHATAPRFDEQSPIQPRSPYAASKAAADHLVLAHHVTHGLDAVVSRCSNNYGPRQYPEKLIPLMVTRGLAGESLPVYGDGRNVRDWIHVSDHCRGLCELLQPGLARRVYHFGGDCEKTNLEVVRRILDALDVHDVESRIAFVADRPGHDRRYGMSFERTRSELGWTPEIDFETGLAATVAWYRDHPSWFDR
jgi:dTDP-glucose 4,6-dehydratase